MPKKTDLPAKAKALGFRSGIEYGVSEEMKVLGWRFEYDHPVFCCFNYYKTVKNGKILTPEGYLRPAEKGEKVVQLCTYTVDFCIMNTDNPWYIETKGLFTSADMAKHRRIMAQYPTAPIRLLFEANNKIPNKGSMRYSDWCIEQGVRFGFIRKDPQTKSTRYIPEEWL